MPGFSWEAHSNCTSPPHLHEWMRIWLAGGRLGRIPERLLGDSAYSPAGKHHIWLTATYPFDCISSNVVAASPCHSPQFQTSLIHRREALHQPLVKISSSYQCQAHRQSKTFKYLGPRCTQCTLEGDQETMQATLTDQLSSGVWKLYF